jgi:hypothetical protein
LEAGVAMPSNVRVDLLHTHGSRRVLHQPWLPVTFQVIGLAGILFLLVNGWGLGRDSSPTELLTLRKTNLTTLVVWGLWWPAMVLSAIALGRAWCTVCPMELTSRVGRWVGRHLGLAALPIPRLARAGWLVIAAYVMLQLLVAGLSIHRVPHATALLLATLLGGSALMGLVMKEERAFCKTACPAKALLSVYGRFTPIQLDIRDDETCRACTTRECVSAEYRDRGQGAGQTGGVDRPSAGRAGRSRRSDDARGAHREGGVASLAGVNPAAVGVGDARRARRDGLADAPRPAIDHPRVSGTGDGRAARAARARRP